MFVKYITIKKKWKRNKISLENLFINLSNKELLIFEETWFELLQPHVSSEIYVKFIFTSRYIILSFDFLKLMWKSPENLSFYLTLFLSICQWSADSCFKFFLIFFRLFRKDYGKKKGKSVENVHLSILKNLYQIISSMMMWFSCQL